MSGAERVKNQADWDLERCFEMFDEALTSKDERVVNALRNLLMVVALTAPESSDQGIDGRRGPLRRLMSDHNDLIRRLNSMDDELQQIKYALRQSNATGTNWPYGGAHLDTNTGKYYGGGGLGGSGGLSSDFTAKMEVAKTAMMAGLDLGEKNVKP